MIVISRSVSESIRLGEHALVRVERVIGERVLLAIEVGPRTPVPRGEVFAEIERLREEAQSDEPESR
jgi:sRNA-binding carbon storage regulator CsrA